MCVSVPEQCFVGHRTKIGQGKGNLAMSPDTFFAHCPCCWDVASHCPSLAQGSPDLAVSEPCLVLGGAVSEVVAGARAG